MIKKLFTAAILMGAVSVNAQELKTNHILKGIKYDKPISGSRQITNNSVAASLDTLYPATLMAGGCAVWPTGTYYYYPYDFVAPTDTGYIFGSNTYTVSQSSITYTVQLQEAAQKYNVSGMASVTGILVPTPKASSASANTMITANIYSENTTSKAPLISLGASTPKSLNSFSTTNVNTIVFGTPVSLSSQNFFASIVSPPLGGTNMDTLALLGTSAGVCSSTDSLSWVKQVINGGLVTTWYSVNQYFQNSNLDLLIFPIISITSSTGSVSQAGLSLYAASPNPAANSININFALNAPSKVNIDVYDLTGKMIKSIKNNDQFQSGKNAVALDLTDLAPGSYLYTISSGVSKMAGKFVVTK